MSLGGWKTLCLSLTCSFWLWSLLRWSRRPLLSLQDPLRNHPCWKELARLQSSLCCSSNFIVLHRCRRSWISSFFRLWLELLSSLFGLYCWEPLCRRRRSLASLLSFCTNSEGPPSKMALWLWARSAVGWLLVRGPLPQFERQATCSGPTCHRGRGMCWRASTFWRLSSCCRVKHCTWTRWQAVSSQGTLWVGTTSYPQLCSRTAGAPTSWERSWFTGNLNLSS